MIKRRAASIVLVAVLFCIRAISAVAESFDWPRWGGPDGNWVSKESDWDPQALNQGPRVLWTANVGLGYSNVAIRDNRLYAMGLVGDSNVVSCLNAETGKKVWQFAFESLEETQSTPTVEEDSVYALNKDGLLFCLDARNGKLRWKVDVVAEHRALKPYYGFAGSPVVEGDLVILTANTAGMAFDRRTGKLAWSSDPPPKEARYAETNGTDYSTPIVYTEAGRRAALLYSWNGLSSVEAGTGELLWVFRWNFYFVQVAEPVLIGDQVLLTADWAADYSRQSVLLKRQEGTPAVVWRSRDLFCDISTPVILDGCIYACYGGPHTASPYASLRCTDLKTGKMVWENFLEGQRSTRAVALMATDGKLLVLTRKGTLYIANASPAGFTPLSQCDVLAGKDAIRMFYTPPVLCNGRIYCRNYAGECICIDVRR